MICFWITPIHLGPVLSCWSRDAAVLNQRCSLVRLEWRGGATTHFILFKSIFFCSRCRCSEKQIKSLAPHLGTCFRTRKQGQTWTGCAKTKVCPHEHLWQSVTRQQDFKPKSSSENRAIKDAQEESDWVIKSGNRQFEALKLNLANCMKRGIIFTDKNHVNN